ncbi:MAG: ATP-binding protein [Candidatus Aramenus sp.]|nr:ATP-binding protein [Candidatus Aramenus sp.]
MICRIPKVTVTTWNSNDVILVGPTYRQFLQKALEAVRNKDIASIIGQPGMGKTTILRKAYGSLSSLAFFLDLSSKGEIEEEFWGKVDKARLRALVVEKLRAQKGKFGYSFFKRLMGVKFEDWLEKVCEKYSDRDLRIYCMSYPKDFDGMIKLLLDLREVTELSLFIDEVRESHLTKIHRLINAGLEIPVIMAIPTDAYSRVTDLAIRRRLDESRISLDNSLTEQDIKEIVDAYCPQLSEELFPIVLSLWKGRELNTVSSILQFVKSQVDKLSEECKEDVSCYKRKLLDSHSLKNPESDSKDLERMIREALSSMASELGITYVHPRGKRIEAKGKYVTVGIFFLKDGLAYLGMVKLMNDDKEEDEEVKLLSSVERVEHEKKEYVVAKKFVITNSQRLNAFGNVKVEVTTMEAVRILQGDSLILEEKLKDLFSGLAEKKGEVQVAS